MTNNPTIDGVPRATIEQALLDAQRVRFPTDKHICNLRALLDAPVVERQPVCEVAMVDPFVLTTGSMHLLKKGDKLYTAPPEVAALQSTIAQLQAEQKLLQSAVARYLDRIAELESGRGEPVAYRHTMHFGENFGSQSKISLSSEDGFGKSGIDYDEIFKVTCEPLFTAPPAPVEVVLPEHIDSDLRSPVHGYARGWNACIDATAALNEVRK